MAGAISLQGIIFPMVRPFTASTFSVHVACQVRQFSREPMSNANVVNRRFLSELPCGDELSLGTEESAKVLGWPSSLTKS